MNQAEMLKLMKAVGKAPKPNIYIVGRYWFNKITKAADRGRK